MGGALTLNITLASEFAPAKVRARMVATMFTGFMIGPAIAGVISMLFIPSYGWRVVLFFALLPLIFLPFLCYFLPESVRFLAQKGRYDRAIKVLEKDGEGRPRRAHTMDRRRALSFPPLRERPA